MTTASFLQNNSDFKPLHLPDETRQVTGVYCGDLLSIVMSRAPADSAWVTVMGNQNSIAVATLADVSLIVLAEGMPLDGEALEKAEAQQVNVIATQLPVFEAALRLYSGL